jgi:hypothetical protein
MTYSKEDWDAAMSSEIFREYAGAELHKMAVEPIVDNRQVLEEFEKFEQKICQSPQLKTAFKALQHKFITDPAYTEKVDPKFVEGVLLLNLNRK